MQNLDWNGVRDFLAVFRSGSLNGAGQLLGVNGSTVGRRIESLETSLGVRLFHRAQTGYVLTDEGVDLVNHAEALEASALAFELRATSTESVQGRVRLATAENFANIILIPRLPAFASQYPDLTLEIVTDIRTVNLHRREADIALRLVRPNQGNVTIRRLGTQSYGLFGSVDYLKDRDSKVDQGRFDKDRFIGWSEVYSDLPASIWIERILEGKSPALIVSSLQSQLAAVRCGLGLAVLPNFLAALEPTLQHIPSEIDAMEEELWLVTHSDLIRSARVRTVATFIEFALRDAGFRPLHTANPSNTSLGRTVLAESKEPE